MWPLAWLSVNELEAAAASVDWVLASVFTAPFEAGGDTAPPDDVAASAVAAGAAAASLAALAAGAVSAGLEQAPSRASDKTIPAGMVSGLRMIVLLDR